VDLLTLLDNNNAVIHTYYREFNMPNNLLAILALSIALLSTGSIALAHEKKQVTLDQACEADRQKALKPRKTEIYQECRQKFKKSEKVCKAEAQAYNGNRIGGAPLFYELPACEKAFNYRKKQANKNAHR
jgi:hypothetical protein